MGAEKPNDLPFDEQYLHGLLVGDGTFTERAGTPRFRLYSTNLRYVRWLTELFGEFIDVVERETYSYDGKDWEARVLISEPHPWVDRAHSRYMANERYPLPRSCSLTPQLMRMWYASDGSLNWPYGAKNPTLQIATTTKQPVAGRYAKLFHELGIRMKTSSQAFYFSTTDSATLIQDIGRSVPGFEYKWETDSEERYRRVKRYGGTRTRA